MKIGLNLAVFSERSLEAALDQVLHYGIETVEINVDSTDPCTPLSIINMRAQVKKIREAVSSRGLIISAVGNHEDSQLIGGPFHSDTDRIHPGDIFEKSQYGIDHLINTARFASELEVETVIGFTGCEDWSRWFPWPEKDGWEKMLPKFIDTWVPILDEFKKLSVRFAHEPHPKQLVYDLETAKIVTDALDNREEWGFNLDVANISLAGVDPAAFIQELPNKIFHVHAKDLEISAHNLARSGRLSHGSWGRPDRGVRFRIPGWGGVDWKGVISQLQLAGYQGSISIEHEDPLFSREEGVSKAVEFLNPLLIREAPGTPWW